VSARESTRPGAVRGADRAPAAADDAPALPDWLAAMMPGGARRRMVDVGGARMAVTEVGHGRPVLLLHGNPSWSFLYRKVAAALTAGGAPLRLVMPDLVGLGFSDKPRDPAAHTIEQHARWLGALLDELALGPLTLVVQDWGGPIGMRAMADRPGELAGLVVLNTVLSPPASNFRATAFHRFARMPVVSPLAFRVLGFPQNAMAWSQGDRSSIRGDVSRAYRYPLRRRRDRVAPLAMARMVPDSFDHPSIAPLRRVQELTESFRGPAAIVWGDRDPILGRVRTWIAKLLPHAEITRTQAGHFLQEEVPDEIAAAITRVTAAT
jgi:cis-3-alkyl-4-acyloxetan-2-one decarboxylase